MKISKGKQYFNSTAKSFYQRYSGKNLAGKELIERYLGILLPLVKDKRVLEIGCGTGTFTSRVSKLNKITVGIDFSENMLHIAKYMNGKTHLLLADALHLPFKNKSFDVVYSIRTLQHIPDHRSALLEMNRVLSTGGIVVFDVMNIMNPFGLVRSVLFRPLAPVYLKAITRAGIYKFCNKAEIEVLHVHPIQLLLDSPNLNRYLPKIIAKVVIKIFRYLDFTPSETSFFAKFALRLFVVGKKKV